jgi:hypothetical protein
VGHGTAGYYAREVKAFTRWLARRRRIAEDVHADLPGASPDQSDHRHDRRTPGEAELRGVIGAAQASPRSFRGLTGRDRSILYATAAASGFRVEELASLTPEAFDLTGDVASVTLRGDVAKNGRLAVQPLPPDLAQALRSYLSTRPTGQPVWPGTWYEKAAAMLRRDLAAAGIPYATEGPEGRCTWTSTPYGTATSPCSIGPGRASKRACSSPGTPTPSSPWRGTTEHSFTTWPPSSSAYPGCCQTIRSPDGKPYGRPERTLGQRTRGVFLVQSLYKRMIPGAVS